MKINTKTFLGLTAIAAIGLTIYLIRRYSNKIKLSQIADEGYEIAHDVLYPDKLPGSKKLHYGPVLPE
jgi:PhoPQ-activated pathogenicity-related protein